LEQRLVTVNTPEVAKPVNLWLMRTRKDLVPWLIGRGASGVRTSAYANQVQSLAMARSLAEKGDRAGLDAALARMLGAGARVSRDVFKEQRLYAYTSGDWSSLFEQRARQPGPDVYEIYQRVKAGGRAEAEIENLKTLEVAARERLSESLFLITGKIDMAVRALRETPLPMS
jgi:hypothetical protein